MKKTVLLTGATGFLGSFILEGLLRNSYNVIILKRSFSNIWRISDLLKEIISYDIDIDKIEKVFAENKVDIVINTATNYGRNSESIYEVLEANLLLPVKILDLAISYNVKTFINTDTFFTNKGLYYNYLKSYTLTKKQLVELLVNFSDKINIINLKLEHIFGIKDEKDKFVVWIIDNLIKEVNEIKLTKGEQKRDFIYISDVVSAYMVILKNINNIKGFNEFEVGTGKSIALKDFIVKVKENAEKILGRKLRTHLKFGSLDYRDGEPKVIKADITKLMDLGWKPNVSIEDGISAVIKYQKDK